MAEYEANQTYIWRDDKDSDYVAIGQATASGEDIDKLADFRANSFFFLWQGYLDDFHRERYEKRIAKITTRPTKVRLVVEPE